MQLPAQVRRQYGWGGIFSLYWARCAPKWMGGVRDMGKCGTTPKQPFKGRIFSAHPTGRLATGLLLYLYRVSARSIYFKRSTQFLTLTEYLLKWLTMLNI